MERRGADGAEGGGSGTRRLTQHNSQRSPPRMAAHAWATEPLPRPRCLTAASRRAPQIAPRRTRRPCCPTCARSSRRSWAPTSRRCEPRSRSRRCTRCNATRPNPARCNAMTRLSRRRANARTCPALCSGSPARRVRVCRPSAVSVGKGDTMLDGTAALPKLGHPGHSNPSPPHHRRLAAAVPLARRLSRAVGQASAACDEATTSRRTGRRRFDAPLGRLGPASSGGPEQVAAFSPLFSFALPAPVGRPSGPIHFSNSRHDAARAYLATPRALPQNPW
eukprot:361612-Chlamydomonas_euryale.AAC.17